ncbi:mannitol dehydrogenase family protein [Nonomuraea solani]|uniref:mannitol dehydrogenase family protein n=1 Tax=Nonomuraea solani TaxID=1144553 RepID=UPI00190E6E59|nr:mannitol dehydrogenase family protein [Nonomuraea solani]
MNRAVAGRPAAPVRILHLGLGGFFRAHQAWYTDHAPDAAGWGIAAFTGRSTRIAARLAAQDGLYTLVTRGRDGDAYEVIGSVSAVHPGGEHGAWLAYWRRPELAVVTLTVTEAGYTRGPGGGLDLGLPEVAADLAALRADPEAPVGTAAARLVAGLAARRRAGGGPVAIVSCDNLPGNGEVTARVVEELAEAAGLRGEAAYVTTMVDRITPYPEEEDVRVVAGATGWADAAPVVTEPFAEWVLSGDFPAGRPEWDARFAADATPYEERKLWLLNGGHSLLAYAASLRGHVTVAEAVADPVCRGWLAEWWAEASRHLEFPEHELAAYREALLERFANPRIRHTLAKIAEDGSQKVPVRILPALRAERAQGRMPGGVVRALAAWLLHLRGGGVPVRDAAAPVAGGSLTEAARAVLAWLEPGPAEDAALVEAIVREAGELS